jgi:carboxylesterase type B
LEGDLIGTPPKFPPQNAPDVFDEFECLNLNITTPPNSHEGSDFPVMVYIHGGGGYAGSNSDWWCDGGALVSKSIAMEKPIVHVAIK